MLEMSRKENIAYKWAIKQSRDQGIFANRAARILADFIKRGAEIKVTVAEIGGIIQDSIGSKETIPPQFICMTCKTVIGPVWDDDENQCRCGEYEFEVWRVAPTGQSSSDINQPEEADRPKSGYGSHLYKDSDEEAGRLLDMFVDGDGA